MTNLKTKTMLFVGLAAMAMAPAVKADDWNQKTTFTFSGPVAIPGQVLPAGTYVFKLLNSSSSRHVVQVFNQDENHVYGTFLAIPDYHMHASSQTLVKFHERPAGEPQAIKSWFYPGRNYGHEFVYPKNQAVQLAQLNDTPVPAMPTELAEDTVKPDVKINAPEVVAIILAPVMVEKPTGEEVSLETAFPATPDTTKESTDELPSTASWLPLIGLLGLLSLGTAAGLRAAASVKEN
ncbi:MAG TPA: hypothetical protein VME43_27520 [Bryobacteraceae bacterium]|nr:hypothetical protein [Bryobacteraceae bacterium]